MAALDSEIEQTKKRLKQLEDKQKENKYKVINDCLNQWRKLLEQKANKKTGDFELTIGPYSHARRSPLQCMHYVQMCSYDETEWSYENYMRSDADGKPMIFYGPSVDSLFIHGTEYILATHGVTWKIEREKQNDNIACAYNATDATLREIRTTLDSINIRALNTITDHSDIYAAQKIVGIYRMKPEDHGLTETKQTERLEKAIRKADKAPNVGESLNKLKEAAKALVANIEALEAEIGVQ